MFGKFKTWHSGLSLAGKVVLWSVSAVVAGSAINTSASIGNKTPTTEVPVTSQVTKKEPVISTNTVTETSEIPFSKTTVNDNNLAQGKSEIRTAGVNGIKTYTYEISYVDGVETDKKLNSEEVTTAPVDEVTAIGTYIAPKQQCDQNYSGACVPIASDVDCAGGSGNGPAYTYGPVYVVGYDIYGLDRDGDGVGCE